MLKRNIALSPVDDFIDSKQLFMCLRAEKKRSQEKVVNAINK
jgi:hypothetical protein